MAAIEIPEPTSSAELLHALDAALEKARAEINESAEAIAEVERLARESGDLEARMDEVKRTMFLLMHEKLQNGILNSSIEYIDASRLEMESLASKAGGKGSGKP